MTVSPGLEEIDRAVRGWVAEGSALDSKYVLRGNSDGPAPLMPFATVLAITREREGVPNRRIVDNDEEVQVTYRTTYSVQWYREDAHANALEFIGWASSSNGLRDAQLRGFAYNGVDSLRRLDDVVESEWEERAGIDLVIGYTVRYTGEEMTFFAAPANAGGVAVEIEL